MKFPKLSPYTELWITLCSVFCIILMVSFMDEPSYSPRQATFRQNLLKDGSEKAEEIVIEETVELKPDEVAKTDTASLKILLFGDSMATYLGDRLGAYGEANGHTVVAATWVSSTTTGWAGCDSLKHLIARYKPDYIMVALGSNEMFMRSYDGFRKNVVSMVKEFGGRPFIWIGPPNWKKDTGLNDVLQEMLPKGTFFRTEGMTLARANDNIHPTRTATYEWMDSVMRWIPSSAHPMKHAVPADGTELKHYTRIYWGPGGNKAKAPEKADSKPAKKEGTPAAPAAAPQEEAAPAQEAPKQAAPEKTETHTAPAEPAAPVAPAKEPTPPPAEPTE